MPIETLPAAVDAIGEGALGLERAALAAFILGLLLTFVGIRVNTRLIRAQVSWWFHDIESDGGLHVHHMVIGVILMVTTGLLMIALLPTGLWLQLIALFFGGGVALTLDEFALILRLQDVYWTKEGRLSVDAVVVVLCVAVLLLLGFRPLVSEGDAGTGAAAHAAFVSVLIINFAFAVLCFLKGKMWTGLFGLFIPIVAEVGAIRLARPGSPWARWRYQTRPKRMARAQRREERISRHWRAWKTALLDAVAGKPHLPSLPPSGADGVGAADAAAGAEGQPASADDPPASAEDPRSATHPSETQAAATSGDPADA